MFWLRGTGYLQKSLLDGSAIVKCCFNVQLSIWHANSASCMACKFQPNVTLIKGVVELSGFGRALFSAFVMNVDQSTCYCLKGGEDCTGMGIPNLWSSSETASFMCGCIMRLCQAPFSSCLSITLVLLMIQDLTVNCDVKCQPSLCL